jgi:hypothetical protein
MVAGQGLAVLADAAVLGRVQQGGKHKLHSIIPSWPVFCNFVEISAFSPLEC